MITRKGNCGCPYCKGERVPTTRMGWKARKNSHDRGYGTFRKPNAKHSGHQKGM